MSSEEKLKKVEYDRQYYQKNRQKKLKYQKKYAKENSDKIAKYQKEYREKNKNKLTKQHTERCKYRRKTDIQFRLIRGLRDRIKDALKGKYKAGSIIKSLGCTVEELKHHLESQWEEGMTWDNWTIDGWHIDHVIPLSSFDLTDPDQFKKACHYTNLQPLWAKDNIRKSNELSRQ
jgi:hypothetical protein